MPMPREYTIIMRDLVEDKVLHAESVLRSLLNWLSEDEVYMFCQDEYDEITNSVYKAKRFALKAKHDALDASNEEVEEDD